MTQLLFPLPPEDGTPFRDWLDTNIAAEFPNAAVPEDGPEREEFVRLLYNAGQQYIVWCRTCRALMDSLADLGEPLDMDSVRMRLTILVESAELDADVDSEHSEIF
jgi:hypothetical protein